MEISDTSNFFEPLPILLTFPFLWEISELPKSNKSSNTFLINNQNQIKVKLIQKTKTQKLQFVLTSLYDSHTQRKN